MKKRSSIWIFVLVVVLLPFIAFGIVNWFEKTYSKLPYYGSSDHAVADFRFTNQRGRTITLNEWNDKIIVADFFFTSCPSICPKMTRNMVAIHESFTGDKSVQFNSFTVDPEHDDVARLKEYAGAFGIPEEWNLLTGDKQEIYKLARKSFLVDATDGDGGVNDFIHSDRLVLIDKKKKIRGFYDGTDQNVVKLLISDIKKLKRES